MKITPQISLKFSVILGISLLVLLMIVLAAVSLRADLGLPPTR